jgi:hypothetical protein
MTLSPPPPILVWLLLELEQTDGLETRAGVFRFADDWSWNLQALLHSGQISIPGPVGFLVDKVAQGQVFWESIGFLCQFSFHVILHTSLSSEADAISQLVVGVWSKLSLPSPDKLKSVWNILVRTAYRAWFGEIVSLFVDEWELSLWRLNMDVRNLRQRWEIDYSLLAVTVLEENVHSSF